MAMHMPPAIQMTMPARMMYPLRTEFKAKPQAARDMLMLRSEFKNRT
jgi:hypothetical protein